MNIFHPKSILILTVVVFLFCSTSLAAKEVAVSFKLESHLIERVLIDKVFKGKGQSIRVNDDGTGCNFLKLAKPRVIDTNNQLIKVRVDTWARVGQAVGERCIMLLDWRGKTDLYTSVKLLPDGRSLKIKVEDSKLLNQQGAADKATNQLWQWFNNSVYPTMNAVTVDLREPIKDLQKSIPLFIPKSNQQAAKQLTRSFAIKSVTINPKGVLLSLHFDVPQVTSSGKKVTALTQAEIAQLEKKLDALDGFITFTIRQFLTPDTPPSVRAQLLNTLINLRYDIIAIIKNPEVSGEDPVKRLFISTWQTIAPLVREVAKLQPVNTISLEYLTFITANDVLYTIEEIGPAFNLDISVNGLTRLARLLSSNPKINPLEFTEDSIPGFYFQQKMMTKSSLDFQLEKHNPWLDFFIPSAHAAGGLNKKTVNRLNNWVPKNKEINKYLPMVQQVINHVIAQQLKQSDLDKKYHGLYRNLVYATAWQESCWKQFGVVKGKRWPLTSRTGDLGMMQLNPRVWRGFYNLHDVKWDILYNTNAGAEILMHYLQHYAIRKQEHKKTGKVENLARATYSVYNGGPRQYKRYRDETVSKKLRRADGLFYKKYQKIDAGNDMAVRSCFGKG